MPNFTQRMQAWEWRRGSESNRRIRSCSPLHNHSATAPLNLYEQKTPAWAEVGNLEREWIQSGWRSSSRPQTPTSRFTLKLGAGNEIRTRDPNLGKVVLYQLSYSRFFCSAELPRTRSRILPERGSLSRLFLLPIQYLGQTLRSGARTFDPPVYEPSRSPPGLVNCGTAARR